MISPTILSRLNAKIICADSSTNMLTTLHKALDDSFHLLEARSSLHVLEHTLHEPNIGCIIMDLPHLDGFKTIHMIKTNYQTFHIPIIILSSHLTTDDMLLAIEMGADDFITKPFEPAHLKQRVLMNLSRNNRDLHAHPLTRLPGTHLINKLIMQRLSQPLSIVYIDIDNFKAYNDAYGLSKGDEVLQQTAHLLHTSIQKHGTAYEFLGHVGGDDFVIITHPEKAELIAHDIATRFDQMAPSFYNKHDQHQKKITTINRRGDKQDFPLMTLSLSIVTNEKRKLNSLITIGQIGAELKAYAKSKPDGGNKSVVVKDRRVG